MALSHAVEPLGEQITVRLHGELDLATVNELTAVLKESLAQPTCRRVLVDLTEVTFLDSVTIGALVLAYNKAANTGNALSVTGATGQVHRILELAGVLDVLTGRSRLDTGQDADAT
jgi:anti-sigma B factor antagonist